MSAESNGVGRRKRNGGMRRWRSRATGTGHIMGSAAGGLQEGPIHITRVEEEEEEVKWSRWGRSVHRAGSGGLPVQTLTEYGTPYIQRPAPDARANAKGM